MLKKSLAPIALFIYNRPEHTLKVLQGLKANELADESELFVFADGYGENVSKEAFEAIQKTRQIIGQEQWCAKVHLIEVKGNKGSAVNIVSGVTELCTTHGKVIVLEDDLVVGKGFIRYMNEALDIYKDDPEVMHVGGYMLPINHKLPDTVFLSTMLCWGWGTWQRAWTQFVPDSAILFSALEDLGFPENYNITPNNNFIDQLKANIDGTANTWAIKWLTTIYLKGGLCLAPGKSLLRNIGHDGTGIHSGVNKIYQFQEIDDYVPVSRIDKKENQLAFKLIKRFYKRREYTFKNRIMTRIFNTLGKNY